MATDLDVVERLAQVVDGVLAVEEFEDWFLLQFWDVEGTPLVHQVEAILAETSGGEVEEVVVVERLVGLLRPATITTPLVVGVASHGGPVRYETYSASEPVNMPGSSRIGLGSHQARETFTLRLPALA